MFTSVVVSGEHRATDRTVRPIAWKEDTVMVIAVISLTSIAIVNRSNLRNVQNLICKNAYEQNKNISLKM